MSIFEPAVSVSPLTGPLPTWRMDEEPAFWATVATVGDPSREALDAHIVAIPAATGDVVVAEPVTAALRVVAS